MTWAKRRPYAAWRAGFRPWSDLHSSVGAGRAHDGRRSLPALEAQPLTRWHCERPLPESFDSFRWQHNHLNTRPTELGHIPFTALPSSWAERGGSAGATCRAAFAAGNWANLCESQIGRPASSLLPRRALFGPRLCQSRARTRLCCGSLAHF